MMYEEAASPIPQQWWDQDGNVNVNSTNPPPPPPPPLNNGMNGMNGMSSDSRGTMSNSQSNNNNNNNNMGITSSDSNSDGINYGMNGVNGVNGVNHQQRSPSSAMDNAAADGGEQRGYFRPGLRASSPNIQKRMENMNFNSSPDSNNNNNENNNHQNTNLNSNNDDSEEAKPNSNGLIRLTLKKPMGIVFEPMEDPHNPSQQRGVRICDLPRTGAAAMSRKLEIGDELLSINQKTMSRLTFDEILDFILAADADNVHLLFRRPKKSKPSPSSKKRNSKNANKHSNVKESSVKWHDGGTVTQIIEPDPIQQMNHQTDNYTDEETIEDSVPGAPSSASKKNKNSPSRRSPTRRSASTSRRSSSHPEDDETFYSGDETYITEETEETRRRVRARRNRRNRNKYANETFLDMLIDSICAPMLGEPPKSKGRGRRDEYSDDDTYPSGDDSTYVTYDSASYVEMKKSRKNAAAVNKKKSPLKSSPRRNANSSRNNNNNTDDDDDEEDNQDVDHRDPFSTKKASPKNADKDLQDMLYNDTANSNNNNNNNNVGGPTSASPARKKASTPNSSTRPSSSSNNNNNNNLDNDGAMNGHYPGTDNNNGDTDHGTNQRTNTPESNKVIQPQSRFEPQLQQSHPSHSSPMNHTNNNNNNNNPSNNNNNNNDDPSLEQDANIPIAELEYDDRIDHGADVSVMESLGGPSLLIENMRNNAAAAALNSSPPAPPVSNELLREYGADYPPELGLTREESIQLDPTKFYRHVVKVLLELHEPEKVRLLDKLFAKYKGREEHLIQKLKSRYTEEKEDGGKAATGASPGRGGNNNNMDTSNEDIHGRGGEKSAADDGFHNFNGFPKIDETMDVDDQGPDADAWNTSKDKFQSASNSNNNNNAAAGGGNGRRNNHDNDEQASRGSQSTYTEEDSDYESIDGTSPAVIAQVSELLNYVYGKTSVPGQIDRVSTIMRAYEGREAVLLELLETKALLKANAERDSADNLPESLRQNPGLLAREDVDIEEVNPNMDHIVSPVSNPSGMAFGNGGGGGGPGGSPMPVAGHGGMHHHPPLPPDGGGMPPDSYDSISSPERHGMYPQQDVPPMQPSSYSTHSSSQQQQQQMHMGGPTGGGGVQYGSSQSSSQMNSGAMEEEQFEMNYQEPPIADNNNPSYSDFEPSRDSTNMNMSGNSQQQQQQKQPSPMSDTKKKKKKGIFGGLFKKKNKNKKESGAGAFPSYGNQRGGKKGGLLRGSDMSI